MLKREQVLCPAAYACRKSGVSHASLDLEKPYHWTSSTVANMLENELYLGDTVNMKYSTRSYKDKRHMEHPREECLVIEGSHEPLIDRETWDIVQRVRRNKHRRTKMEEQNKYSGLVVCADCGKAMVLHRAHTMAATYSHFICRTYKKDGGKVCTAHYVRECILNEVVLEDLRWVTAQAREYTREFAEYISGRQSAEVQRDIRGREKELAALNKQAGELDAIFRRLYEENICQGGFHPKDEIPPINWNLSIFIYSNKASSISSSSSFPVSLKPNL